jgi:DNA-binding GntR family transcriptional regulator
MNHPAPRNPAKAGDAPSEKRGPRQPYSSAAYELLKQRILDNEMTAGFQATEHELAEALGMSRTPVREAMIRLANEGLIEIRPRHGLRVLPVSARDMCEIYDILTALESTAAELLARRGLGTEQDAALDAAVTEMDTALTKDDLLAWAQADERFHMLLVDFCGNRRLKALVGNMWGQAHRVRMVTLRLRPRPTQSNADHREVVDAIRRRDPEAARRVHHNHRLRAGEILVGLLESHGLTHL